MRRRKGEEEHTFALQRRGEVGVIVTITTGGPVAMETGGSGGWGRDEEREDTHRYTHTHIVRIFYVYPHKHALTQRVTRRCTLTVCRSVSCWGGRWHMPG